MIALWMGYAALASFLLGAAGAAAEICLRALGRPGRGGVVVGLAASITLPAAILLAPRGLLPIPAWRGPVLAALDIPPLTAPRILAEGGAVRSFGTEVGTYLLALWILGTLATIVVGIIVQRSLVHSALRCSLDTVDGTNVRCTRRFGPAVVGCLTGIILLPNWARSLETNPLRLLLAHEKEHVRARDPLLLLVCFFLVSLQPWNPALWWQLSRLKRAIELDCDRRVLSHGADPKAYASLLLELASFRKSGSPFAVALGSAKTRVGRRVMVLVDSISGPRPLPAVVAGGCSAILLMTFLWIPAPGAGASQTSTNAGRAALEMASLLPPLAPPLPQTGPVVVRGEEARRILTDLRESITLRPLEPALVEVLLEDGGKLRITREADSPGARATLVQRDPTDRPGISRRVSLHLDIVDGEPVFTLTEV